MSKDILDIFNLNAISRFLGLKRCGIRRGTGYHKREKEILRRHGEKALSELKKSRTKKNK